MGITIAEVRAKFPQYESLSDSDLASKIHQKYYPDMDVGQFNRSIGFNGLPPGVRPEPRPTVDPQAAIEQFVQQTQDLSFPTPPPSAPRPAAAPVQPIIPDTSPDALPNIQQPHDLTPMQDIPSTFLDQNAERANAEAPSFGMMGAMSQSQQNQAGQEARRLALLERAAMAAAGPVAPPPVDHFADETFGALSKRRGQQFARGATEVFASVPEALAIADRIISLDVSDGYKAQIKQARDAVEQMSVILDSGHLPEAAQANMQKTVEMEMKKISDLSQGQEVVDASNRLNTKAEEREGFSAGAQLRQVSKNIFGEPDKRDQAFWGKVAEGGGNMAGMMVSSIGAGLLAIPVGGSLGSAMNTSSMYKEAIKFGADEETALLAAKWGSVIGASEIVPISRAMKILPKSFRNKIGQGFMRKFAHIAQSSGEEAAQEYLATVANNIVAQKLYDPKRGWTKGATEAALVGAVLGGGTGTVGAVVETATDAVGATPKRDDEPPETRKQQTSPIAPQTPATPAPEATPVNETGPKPQPVDEPAQATQPEPVPEPVPEPALPAASQPAPAVPVGQDALSPQQQAGEPPLQSDPTSVARADDDFNAKKWEEVPGAVGQDLTGRTWMHNAETGETISKEDYDKRAAAQPSPTGEGEVAQKQGEADETIPNATSKPAIPGADASVDGAGSLPDGDRDAIDVDSGTLAQDRPPVPNPGKPPSNAQPDAAPSSDPSPTVDAGTSGPSNDAGVSQGQETGAAAPVSAPGYEGRGAPLDDRQTKARDWLNSNGYENIGRVMDMDASKGYDVSSAAQQAEILQEAAASKRTFPDPNENGMYSVGDVKPSNSFTLPNPKKGWKGVPNAKINVMEVAPGKWVRSSSYNTETGGSGVGISAKGAIYDSRDSALAAEIKGMREKLERSLLDQSNSGAESNKIQRIMQWLDKAESTLKSPTGAAADPAFKAAKDSGKLEVISVTGKSDGPAAGTVGATKLAPSARMPISEAGSQWDGMTPKSRADMLLDATPGADKKRVERLSKKAWADIADAVKAPIARRMTATPEVKAERNQDRPLSDGKKFWDAMTPQERVNMLSESNPSVSRDRFVKLGMKNWRDISEKLQATLMGKMPEGFGEADPAPATKSEKPAETSTSPAPEASKEIPVKVSETGDSLGDMTPEQAFDAAQKLMSEGGTTGGIRKGYTYSYDQWHGKNRVTAPKGKLFIHPDRGLDAYFFNVKDLKNLTSKEIAEEAAQADPDPTDAQKEAGNYKAGHISWNGLDITIENAKGSERSGTDGDGETWSVTMPAHYGYIKRTEGADGDHVDVYIGENPESDRIFIVDQVDLDDSFDEHKVLIGFNSGMEAFDTHAKAFSDGTGLRRQGGFTEMDVSEFKGWLDTGDTTKPLQKKEEATRRPPQQSDFLSKVTKGAAGSSAQFDLDQPSVRLAESLSKLIGKDGFPSTNVKLMKMAADEFGGTIAEGKFSPKDAYEALELAMNMFVSTDGTIRAKAFNPSLDKKRAVQASKGLTEITNKMPTQTRRDTETDTFQQFSTPPAYAFAANWIANIQDGERVLEPSAGNGGIAVFAKNAGARVDVNELAERRVPSLRALGFDRVTTEDAEQIANIWDGDKTRSYDVVVMNPPFSASAGRTSKNTSATGAKHIDQALSVLKPGGRLVAIMGHTFQPSNSRVASFFNRIEKNGHSLRANVVVKGDQVYKKYGTTYDNRILVIDKVAPANGSETLKGEVATIPDLIELMEEIRNEASNRRTKDGPSTKDAGFRDGDRGGAPDVDGGKPGNGKPERNSKPDDLGGQGDRPGRDGGSDGSDGRRNRADADSKSNDSKRETGSDNAGKRASGSSGTAPDGRSRPTVRVSEADATKVEETSGGFAKYRPARVRIEGAKEHPIALVESSAMATVKPPKPNYDLKLPAKMVKDGLLSEAQLEQVMYAGAAHSEMLPSLPDQQQKRKGYYIGDGTGVGKTREIAGIIADNWAQGRKKHILISKDKKLLKGARRDFDNVGMKSVAIEDLGKVKSDGDVAKDSQGVLFATYATIGRTATADNKSRLDQIVDWVGPDFDGTITFDEAHLAGNALPIKGKRGTSKPSATALAVVDLQELLPNARIVYASATAATEVYNLAYADRLGLWGPGTAFPTVENFVTQIDKGGVAAMEVVARDMKQMGVYMARSISFDGVEYGKVEHELSQDQRAMYDAAAEGWQTILSNVQEVVQEHTEGGGRQRGAALAQFWGAHQRFFQQTLTAMQMPTVLKNIDIDLKAGLSPVIQIVNTNEAATKRAMAKLEDGDTLDDIDITPREDLMQYLETSFPVHQYEDFEDDNGSTRQRPVKDSDGNFVKNKEAVRIRDELMDRLGAMTLPGNPLDMIIDKFGSDNVAEITGRTQRIVKKHGKRVTERRSQSKTMAEAGEFQGGKRDLLIFSDAGGTGMDFHADKDAKNTKRRSHYVLQAGWRADRAIQGFGRTHRTNQAQPPIYKLAGTNLSGHKRFTSSIARRLDQLGALTKGQKDASGSGMFNATDNLENEFADTAVEALFYQIWRGEVDGFTIDDAQKELGLNLVGETGFNVSKIPSVPQFLNRLLNTKIDRQNMLFDRFVEHMQTAVQQAVEDGQFTAGVEAVAHDGAVLVDTKEANRDSNTDATSHYQMVKLTKKVEITPFKEIDSRYKSIKYKKDRESGAVFGFRPASSRTNDNGQVIPTYHRYSPTNRNIVDSSDYQFRYEPVKPDEAEAAWNEAIEDAPDTREETLHMVTGALLPIWDRLPASSPKIVRLHLDDGQSLLGREIPDVELTRTLANLGVTGPDIDMSGAEIQAAVIDGKTVVLSSGHKIVRRRVGGEQRIEIVTPPNMAYEDVRPGGNLQRMGFQIEKINYKARAFAATSEKGLPAIDAFMVGKSIINVTMGKDQRSAAPVSFTKRLEDIKLIKDLRKRLDGFGLRDVDMKYDPNFHAQGHAYGDFFNQMTITIGNTLNPKWTLGHEAIHIYKHMGIFTKEEWSVLAAEAKSKWMDRYNIAALYPELNVDEQLEEAVAEAFGEAYQAGAGFRTTSGVRALLGKIHRFMKAIIRWAKGNGMKSPEDIIEGIARGEFAKRVDVKGWQSQTARLTKERRKPSETERTGGGMHLPDRYIWDTLKNSNGNIFSRIKQAKSATSDRFDLMRTRLQDRFLPVLRAQQIIERQMKAPIPEELNAYLAEEMYSGRTGYKLDVINRDYTSKIIKIIGSTKGVTTETVGRFLNARHAAERNERIAKINPEMPDGGSGMMTAQADAILKEIQASPQASAYQSIADMIDSLREWSIQERLDMGLMTKGEASAWRNSYKAYVPLKGWAETDFSDAELDVTGIGRGYNVRGGETRRAFGRKTEAFNPLIAAITQAQEVAIRSEKNRVGQHLYRLAKDVPAKGLWEVKRVETTRVFNESTGLVENRNMSPITMMQAPNEMAVKVDGEEHRIIFNDHRLARAATRVGVDNLGALMQPLSIFGRYISTMNTMLNPEFVINNFARDTVTANVNIQSKELGSKIQRGMMKDLPKAMRGTYRGLGGKSDSEWSQYFQEFSEAGGKVSFWVMENPESNQKMIEKRMRREANGLKGAALSVITPSIQLNPVLRAIERINLAVDNAIRLAAFVHGRKNGMSAQEAASLSKNLTVNFNRRGDYGSAINSAYVFANAAMQGSHIMFKALKSRKVQMIVSGMVITSFLLDQANAYLSEEDEDGQLAYDKIPEFKHERSLVIGLGGQAGNAITIPMPYGYNAFTYMGNRLSKMARGAITPQEALSQTSLAAFNSFSPVNGNSFMSLITPTILDPAIEIATNTDWLGRPISPDYPNQTGPDSQKFFGSVTDVARIVTEKLNAWTGGSYAESGYVDVSPESVDHISGFLTGGVGRTLGRTTDLFAKLFRGEDVAVNDVPIARTLYLETGEWLDRSNYFNRRAEIREANAAVKAYAKNGDPVPEEIQWKADLYKTQQQSEKFRRGTKSVEQDEARAYLLLNSAYIAAWKKNTPYSSESIFGR